MFIIKIPKYIQNLRKAKWIMQFNPRDKKFFNDFADAEARYPLSTAGWFGLLTSKIWGRESVVDQVAGVQAWQPRNRGSISRKVGSSFSSPKRPCLGITQPLYINGLQRGLFCSYLGVDKSLAPPGRKQATVTQTLTFASHSKKNSESCLSNQVCAAAMNRRVGRKMVTFQLFFQSGRAKDLSALL